MNKLIGWITNKRWEVYFGRYQDKMESFSRIIHINEQQKAENQLYTLLHECGHIIVFNRKDYKNNYPTANKMLLSSTINKTIARSKKFKIDELFEEMDAWREGRKLAKKLKIYINEKNFNDEMYKALQTYINNG